jgi:nucleoside-diphosphate-sugar epimerase
MSKTILITGVNGFIGSKLTEALLSLENNFKIIGIDIFSNRVASFLAEKKIEYHNVNLMKTNNSFLESCIEKADIVIPLAAIALPEIYLKNPIKIFELDFESNVKIIKLCVKYSKRIIFPSTSEVYGLSLDELFNEETTNLVTGPINKQRWIYSSTKQLMDRLIYAYGAMNNLDYTIFRPFNWIGPKLDNFELKKDMPTSRVVPKMIFDAVYDRKITLIGGGLQRRCFTDIDDAIPCLLAIIQNKSSAASKEIFNIGNPLNNISISHLASLIARELQKSTNNSFPNIELISVNSEQALGKYYQDVQQRIPDITKAKQKLGFNPRIMIKESIAKIIAEYAPRIHSIMTTHH